MRRHTDHRRSGFFDVFPPGVVEINVCVINPGQLAGDWHCHKHQNDYWFVAKGKLAIGISDGLNESVIIQGPIAEVTLIPAGVWHTYRALEETVLIYGLTNHYDPGSPDELRRPYVEGTPWAEWLKEMQGAKA